MTALAFGYLSAAEALVRRGARVDDIPAAQHGHVEIVRLLLDAGEDHSHSTPLHQAILPGHDAVVRWARYAGQTQIENYLRAQGAKTAEGPAQ